MAGSKQGFGKTLALILIGLLVLGLGGFGVTNLSGTVRSIGTVGEIEIGADDYARALQRELAAIEAERGERIGFARARELGVSDAVLARLVAAAAFDNEALRIGLSVGDTALGEEILAMEQFRGPDGKFDREAYRYALERAGMSEAEFEDDIRREIARSLLQGAVMSGVTLPESYTKTLLDYWGERRVVSWTILDRNDLATGLAEPQEADLVAYHAEHAERFTLPERKRITYAWLTPEMIIDSVEVDEEALRAAYEARADEFNTPERRLVERLAFPDRAAAEAARARMDAGEASFEDLVAERGLEMADVDLGDVTPEDLGSAAEAVFAATPGEVVGPVETDLGPALFRINAVLAAQRVSFEEALPELRAELAADRARRAIDARIDAIDDLLAGGATLEDLAAETEMELGRIDWYPGVSEGIAAHEAFRAAAARLQPGDYPRVERLDDGGIFAMRLDEVLPPTLRPLEEVRDEVAAQWRAETLVKALKAQAEPLVSRLKDGAGFEDVGLAVDGRQEITRRSSVDGAPKAFIETVFDMNKGDVRLIDGDGILRDESQRG